MGASPSIAQVARKQHGEVRQNLMMAIDFRAVGMAE
jgi:hypothetical protein